MNVAQALGRHVSISPSLVHLVESNLPWKENQLDFIIIGYSRRLDRHIISHETVSTSLGIKSMF